MKKASQRPQRDFSIFDQMDTEALRQILAQDSYLPENEESDMDAILYIMEVIEKRQAQLPAEGCDDVETAWAKFNTYYRPDADGTSLYEDEEDDEANAVIPQAAAPVSRKVKSRRRLYRAACIIIAFVVVTFAGTLTASAMGYDLWGAMAKWTNETFGFVKAEEEQPAPESPDLADDIVTGSLQNELLKRGIETPMAPTWFPEGYELSSIEVTETPGSTTYFAEYNYDDLSLRIKIKKHSASPDITYEKNEVDIISYETGGSEHFIMHNNETIKAIWAIGTCECSISGEITETELKKMLDSIYE